MSPTGRLACEYLFGVMLGHKASPELGDVAYLLASAITSEWVFNFCSTLPEVKVQNLFYIDILWQCQNHFKSGFCGFSFVLCSLIYLQLGGILVIIKMCFFMGFYLYYVFELLLSSYFIIFNVHVSFNQDLKLTSLESLKL